MNTKGNKLKITDAAREARRRYKREWCKNNPDKVRAAQERYWERKAAEAEKAIKEE